MFLRVLSTLALAFALAFQANAETRYISDDLIIYMHSGPGNQYRIIGSVSAGDKVNLVDFNKDSGYGKIVLSNGREGWLQVDKLQRQPGLAYQLSEVKAQLEKTKLSLERVQKSSVSTHSELSETISAQTTEIEALGNDNARLLTQFQEISQRNSELEQSLSTREQDIQIRFLTRGGMIAGGGLLLGLMLPMLISVLVPKRKKRNDRWM